MKHYYMLEDAIEHSHSYGSSQYENDSGSEPAGN